MSTSTSCGIGGTYQISITDGSYTYTIPWSHSVNAGDSVCLNNTAFTVISTTTTTGGEYGN